MKEARQVSGWLDDWRVLVFVYIVSSGLWGVLAKVAATRLDAMTASFVAVTSATAVVATVALRGLHWHSASGVAAAAAGGLLGGIASLALYGALRYGPANTVIPLSSLYLVLTVVLSWVFLGESITLRHLAGVAFGLVAIALLSG